MARKCEVISETQQIRDLLTNIEYPDTGDAVLLRSDQYLAIGCNLKDLQNLDETLVREIDMMNCLVLYTAEVSVTYMDVEASDALIKWASTFDNVRFCLLEQFLPCGPEHPFARTMIRHFEKLQTPLRSIHKYPSLSDQQNRFRDAGWHSTVAQDLWTLWSRPEFLTSKQRMILDETEPFDEWEELALFAAHYFVLVATKNTPPGKYNQYMPDTDSTVKQDDTRAVPTQCLRLNDEYRQHPKARARRRFGAVVKLGKGVVGYHGGLGLQSRMATTDVYTTNDLEQGDFSTPPQSLQARMCHSITHLNDSECVLAGGRISPDHPLSDCWLRRCGAWQRIDDLPVSRYRHCGVAVKPQKQKPGGILIYGGKGCGGLVLGDWLYYDIETGRWLVVELHGICPPPRFGASMAATNSTEGVVIGGMGQDGVVLSDCWQWRIEAYKDGQDTLKLDFRSRSSEMYNRPYVGRFGAQLVWSESGLILIGGVILSQVLSQEYEILLLDPEDWTIQKIERISNSPCPLLVGCSSIVADGGNLSIIGGGAVCFSFGTHWNEGTWTLHTPDKNLNTPLQLNTEADPSPGLGQQALGTSENDPTNSMSSQLTRVSIPRIRVDSATEFESVVTKGQPVILENIDFGPCTHLWTNDYLIKHVVVHEATTEQMDFQNKNFSYVTKPFGDFLGAINEGRKLYLRSLASDKPAELPADLSRDYPELAGSFQLPPELATVAENAHSSPLRISGPVIMWLHYDVMANILCQVRGAKRLLLFPPSDVSFFHFSPGSSSSSTNVFADTSSGQYALKRAHHHEALLHPRDILYIPPLWLHSASPVDGLSIAVNIFFRNLNSGYAAGKDIYGNRDLQAYETGRRDLQKIVKAFKGLPMDISSFYLDRLANELSDMAQGVHHGVSRTK
ncbi:MAG: tRNA methyltransferase ppm2 [Pycnora praestabilis]|nr:MAG: tRNA methyltransferase ppm2 [Pycnora praestabilis]